jgi:hypothetical protein
VNKGIDWSRAAFVIGTREDLAPTPLPQRVFARECENCRRKTYTETDYPHDMPLLCNVCASKITAQLEHDLSTQILYDLPNDLKIRLIDIAQSRRLPVEEVCKEFLHWKLRRPTKTILYNKTVKKAKK